MTAINSGLHEVPGVRLPLQTASYASSPSPPPGHGHAVLMYSASGHAGDAVTLQLSELDASSGDKLAGVLARLAGSEDATLSISLQDAAGELSALADGAAIDVLLGASSLHAANAGNGGATATFDLFDSESAHDLTLSPQTFTSSTEAFINDNSDSLGVPGDADTVVCVLVAVGSSEDAKAATPDSSKLAVKKARPKASSPNRQGPQQCQVCGKVFGNASALAKHKLTHSDERKYVCGMCGKAFKRQDHLNGHMLTHRNKKPYECKAEGCGKSYCDARSLRRHTENHHTSSSSGGGASSTSGAGAGAAAAEAASPAASSSSSSCIQYAPPPASGAGSPAAPAAAPAKGGSQLQQLLASDPAPSSTPRPNTPAANSSSSASSSKATSSSSGNDGLTKQQLELIQQIMEQTQQQHAAAQKQQQQAKQEAAAAAAHKTRSWAAQSSGGAAAAPDKLSRRHSDSEHFVTLHQQHDANAESAALAELLLHRRAAGTPTSKATVKRAASDPGQTLQLTFQEGGNCNYLSYDATSAAADDAGYFSPSLQDDMFQHVSVNDTMLLQGVDTAHLADTIQFQAASLLQEQTTAEQLQDIASLEDYQAAVQNPAHFHQQSQHSVHSAELQAVLNSPLPVSLADFGAYSQQAIVTSCSPLPKDLSYHGSTGSASAAQSPLHHPHSGGGNGAAGCGSSQYANSPLAAAGAGTVHSPLPSPLTQHDSPSFTYPTPPASQEGQSPSFGHSHGSLATSSLPLSSPHQQQTSDFVQSVIAHGGHVPRVSSPLSAAFYTSTMSSSAAVEAALSEVLPGESVPQGACLTSGTSMRASSLGLYQSLVNPSPPPQSPLSATTPVPSPLSLSSVPASSSSVSSPLPPSAYTPTQNTQISFPLSPHHTLQSQMMPNSEDPLLSSSPKDFGSRKRFEFVSGGLHHSAKLISNGTSDFTTGNPSNGQVTGIVVDSNGELRFVQTSGGQYHSQTKCGTMTGSGAVVNTNMTVMGNGGTTAVYRKTELEVNKVRVPTKCASVSNVAQQNNYQARSSAQRSRLHIALDAVKEEVDDDVFLSPTSVPASPVRMVRKRMRPEALVQNSPPIHMPLSTYQSRLRAPRMSQCSSSPSSAPPSLPYTPAPMLSPTRPGQGLYWQITTASAWPSSTTLGSAKSGSGGDSQSSEESQQGLTAVSTDNAPESDVTPHINVGPQFQCTIPPWNPDREKASSEPSHEHLLWDPGISSVCTDAEVEMYLEFACCAAVPGGGRNKEYALHLLHMCNGNIHEAMLKLMQPTPALPSGHPLLAYDYNESDRWSAEELDMFHQGLIKYDKDFRSIANEIGSKTIKQCIQFYYLWKKVCPEEYKRMRLTRRRQNSDYNGRVDMEFEDIRAEDSRNSIPSFNSRAALNGHIRIHGGGVCGRSPTPDKRPSASTPPTLADILEEFPCKICGKVFNKVKSRSAHMKSHRPPDAEPKKPKLDTSKMEAAEHLLVRSLGVTTSIGLGRHT